MDRFEAQLTCLLPTNWFVKESITLLAPDGQGNVIMSSEPLDRTITSFRYAAIQGELLRKEFASYDEVAFLETTVFGGHVGYLRQFAWTPPGGVRVTQIQLYTAIDGRGYTATATCPTTQFARFEAMFSTLLEALSLRDHRAGGVWPPPQPSFN